MGERLNGDDVTGRRLHPGHTESGPWDGRDYGALETMLADVLRECTLDLEAEQQALAAFRAARSAGAHQARTRHRDDWRPPAERRAGRRGKTTFGVVFASIALGGAAVAAVGSAGSSADEASRETPRPSTAGPHPTGASSKSSGASRATKHPATAKDTEAHCRAYEQVKDGGKALEAAAWQRLVVAAGGKDKVAAYCADQRTQATAPPDKPGDTGKPRTGAANPGKDTAGKTSVSSNGPDDAGNAAGTRSGGGKGSEEHK
ncbi:hypothetical protein [Streptomyces sp. Tue6028]|uniref:hypothetical protein n=1 Tax=Streptomyces sp. Tue6028 TaxID=2036037 RepID=UPI003D710292